MMNLLGEFASVSNIKDHANAARSADFSFCEILEIERKWPKTCTPPVFSRKGRYAFHIAISNK